ncbi:hypothetical protein HWV62_41310 [Athelia sp. TMB]|nr:hypothetical protein HWV62_41310 [Athelia sp. TMB]
MRKCRELSKLPKALHTKSLNFHRTKPGTVSALLGGHTPFDPRNPPVRLDPTHPAARARTPFPRFASPALQVRAFPKALLTAPAAPWPDPPFAPARVRPWGAQLKRLLGEGEGEGEVRGVSLDMAMVCIVGIRATHKSAVVRKKIAARLKTAVGLVATRGAQRGAAQGLVFREGERPPEEWVSPDWIYTFLPTLAVYRMPYPELVTLLRAALDGINAKKRVLEAKWVADATGQRTPRPAAAPRRTRGEHEQAVGSRADPRATEERWHPRPQRTPPHFTQTRTDAPAPAPSRTRAAFGLRTADAPSNSPSPPASADPPAPSRRIALTRPAFGLRAKDAPPPTATSSGSADAPAPPPSRRITLTRPAFGLRAQPPPSSSPPPQETTSPAPPLADAPIPRLFFPDAPPPDPPKPDAAPAPAPVPPATLKAFAAPEPPHPAGAAQSQLFRRQEFVVLPRKPGR